MGLPADLTFRTKGQLAIDLLTETVADDVHLDFVCGDEVYGWCTELREYLEDHDQAYVLRVPSSFRLSAASGVTLTCKQAAARLGRRRGWEIRSAGSRSKGQRWYAWAWLATASVRHHLLIRRHLVTGELAFHYCYLPAGQPASPSRPVRAAGLRWPAKKISSSARTASGSTSPRSACTPRSPGTPYWSWPPWPSAPSPPPCSAAAPTAGRPPQRSQTSPGPPNSG